MVRTVILSVMDTCVILLLHKLQAVPLQRQTWVTCHCCQQ